MIVTPITPRRRANLRYDEWELSRREVVDSGGAGQIGYVHLRAMGPADIARWARDFYPVFNRAGLIVDVRHNRGGNIDSWVLEKLLRRAWFYWQPRVGSPYWNMQWAFRGHMVVLCDAWTASDGEAFAEGFRRLGLGRVIGTRTWGGEIWLTSSNVLVDRGHRDRGRVRRVRPRGAVADRGPRRGPGHRGGQPAARDVRREGRAARGGDRVPAAPDPRASGAGAAAAGVPAEGETLDALELEPRR